MNLDTLFAELRAFRAELNQRLDSQDDAIAQVEGRTRAIELKQAADEAASAEREKFSALRRWLVQAATTGIPGAIAGYAASLAHR